LPEKKDQIGFGSETLSMRGGVFRLKEAIDHQRDQTLCFTGSGMRWKEAARDFFEVS
jgi:hypothetical protein